MQLDKTQIAVRERGMLETLDLSLRVTSAYALPLSVTLVMGVLPMMVVNHLLVGWIVNDLEYSLFTGTESFTVFRYLWNQTLLVYVEVPLATVFATAYIGQSVFQEKPSLRTVATDVLRLSGRLCWTLVVLRGISVLWAVYALNYFADHDGWHFFFEAFLAPIVALYAGGLRAFRPFMSEIVLLERNPLRSNQPGAMTIGRRSSLLHSPSGGDLLGQALGSAVLAALLVFSVFGTLRMFFGVMFFDLSLGIFPESMFGRSLMLEVVFPLSMWIVAGYFCVFRFLSYLDLRIRQEGWEVELKLRAEAGRLLEKMV